MGLRSRTIVPEKANPESVAQRQTGNDANSRCARAKTNYAYGYRPLIERVPSSPLLLPYLFEYGGVIPRLAAGTGY